MFCIVEFVGPDKLVAVAHRNWLCGSEKVYWPPFWKDSLKVGAALQKGMVPDVKTWILYDIHIVGGKYFEKYESARRMLTSDGLDASELSGIEELPLKRNRRCRNKRRSVSDSDSDPAPITIKKKKTSKTSVVLPPPPPVPLPHNVLTLEARPSLVSVASLVRNEETNTNENPNDVPVTVDRIDGTHEFTLNLDNCDFDCQDEGFPDTIDQTKYLSQPPRNLPRASPLLHMSTPRSGVSSMRQTKESDPGEPSTLKESLKMIQMQQELLIAKVDMILEMCGTMMKGRRMPDQPTSRYQLPMTRVENVDDLNELLNQSVNSREELATVLSVTGGDNSNQITHRIMTKLMTDELMMQYSFAGMKGKLGFKDTTIFSCVCDAVRKQPKGAASDNKEIGRAAEYWLKRASLRIKKKTALVHRNDVPPEDNI